VSWKRNFKIVSLLLLARGVWSRYTYLLDLVRAVEPRVDTKQYYNRTSFLVSCQARPETARDKLESKVKQDAGESAWSGSKQGYIPVVTLFSSIRLLLSELALVARYSLSTRAWSGFGQIVLQIGLVCSP
jgi:hypothetical protein